VPARFALLAETADGFAKAHGEGGYRFEALLAAVREAAIIFAAHLGEQELGVAQDSGERIVQLVAEDLAERFPAQNIFRAGKLLRIADHSLRVAQAPLDHLQRNGKATTGALDEIGGPGRHQRGQFRLLIRRANHHYGRMNGQRGNHGVEARHLPDRPCFLGRSTGFLEKDNCGRGIFDDTAGGVDRAHRGDPQPCLLGFEFPASGGA
jgi:hypothetical protein